MAKCKLYDYKNHCWLDFEGHPTSSSIIVNDEIVINYQHAA
jgi:hypothetical protein